MSARCVSPEHGVRSFLVNHEIEQSILWLKARIPIFSALVFMYKIWPKRMRTSVSSVVV